MSIENDAWGKFGDFSPGEDEVCESCPALRDKVCIRWGQGVMRFTPSCVNN
jgi:hypothetical protein